MSEPVKNILLLVATLVSVFTVLEVIARFALPPVSRVNFTTVPATLGMYSDVPGVRYLLRSNATATQHFTTDPREYFDAGATLTYTTNKDGFRGPDVTVKRIPGTFRIIGLGDSFTFGSGVRYEDTFLARLQEKLNVPADGTKVEVLNLGVPAYETVDEVNLLKFKGLKYQPDLVMICFFLNDTNGGATAEEFNRSVPLDKQPIWRQVSRLLDHVAFVIERRQAAKKLEEAYRNSVGDYALGWIRAQESLKEARTLSRENGFDLLFVIFPVLWSLSEDYPFAYVHEKVAAFAKSQSIPVLDLLPYFSGYDGPELWVHPNNQHPNEIAHEVAATALAAFIMEHYSDSLNLKEQRSMPGVSVSAEE